MDKTNTPRILTTQIDRAMQYFVPRFIEEDKIKSYECKLCKSVKNGTQKSNLLTHLRSVHGEIYESKINALAKGSDKYMKQKRLQMMQHLVELVTINKMPFTTLLKSGFQKLMAEQLQILTDAGMAIDLNDKNLVQVKDHLQNTANKIREKIKKGV